MIPVYWGGCGHEIVVTGLNDEVDMHSMSFVSCDMPLNGKNALLVGWCEFSTILPTFFVNGGRSVESGRDSRDVGVAERVWLNRDVCWGASKAGLVYTVGMLLCMKVGDIVRGDAKTALLAGGCTWVGEISISSSSAIMIDHPFNHLSISNVVPT